MRRRLLLALLPVLVALTASAPLPAAAAIPLSPDYGPATWIPASPANYTVSNRPHNYNVDMIVIHDTEGSFADAIAMFQDPSRAGSAHYVVSRTGSIVQMVLEKDIAWHAGNWDYNTRAIGIEHEGFAYVYGSYTTAEYNTSAALAASICSRWGVPLDRAHVVGHSEVPDPNNPGLYGGAEHHTDPGPYWDWTYYLNTARSDAASLPSLPHLGPAPEAVAENGGVLLSWAGHSCHNPIDSYQITSQPAGVSLNLPGTTSSVWIPGLTNGSSYTFTVTAHNSEGTATMASNAAIPGLGCTSASMSAGSASPQPSGTSIVLNATSTACNSAEYAFWLQPQGSTAWTLERDYGLASWTWNTSGLAPGSYELGVWARQVGSARSYDSYAFTTFVLAPPGCASATMTPDLAPPRAAGTTVTFTASSTSCNTPQYEFWVLAPGGSWTVKQAYSATSSWVWDTTGLAAGNYQVGLWARQTGSPLSYDSFFVSTYQVTAGGGCVVSALTPSVASPQGTGASIVFTPVQAGCSKQYKFWLLPPGGSWQVMQSYGVGGTWRWSTAGYATGTYEVGVWEGSSATPNAYESYAITSFALGLGGCASAALSPSAATPQIPGTQVTFTASATGCGSPQFEFWLLGPGGWSVERGYSANANWTFDTTGLVVGTYQVGVWARQAGSPATYESYLVGTYQLAVASCTSAGLSASPASPQPSGTHVTFTATSAGCASPQYEFWGQHAGGPWLLLRGYGSGTTYTWNSTGAGAGAYNIAVWAASGSPNDYDQYAVAPFSIS